MPVIVSPLAGCNLGTASAFLKAEAFNLGMFSATDTAALSTPYNIPVTFTTGSRNNAGVVLALESSANTFDRSLRVSLQQIMGACTANATTDEVTFASHGFADGQSVMFTAAVAPGGITLGTGVYYARATDSSDPTNTFFLYDTAAHAIAGGATGKVNISSTGTTVVLYADRGISEQTATQLWNGSTYKWIGNIVPFSWTGYPIDVTAGKWQFHIFQYGGTTANCALRTSDGTTHPFYCEISSIAATATNDDTLVCAGPVTVNATFTAKGTLGTGETAYAPAIIICRSAAALTPTSLNENLTWDGSASYTLTVNGVMVMGFHSGFRAGGASRISIANAGTLSFITPTVGTKSAIIDCEAGNATYCRGRMSFFVYGERPAYERTTSVGAISHLATSFVTADVTGWAAGDKIAIGRKVAIGVDVNVYTIDFIEGDGVTVHTTTGISTARAAGAAVVRLNGYGFKISGAASGSTFYMNLKHIQHLVLDGVEVTNIGAAGALSEAATSPLSAWGESTAEISPWLITHCSFYGTTVSVFGAWVSAITDKGGTISYVNTHVLVLFSYSPSADVQYSFKAVLTQDHNIILNNNAGHGPSVPNNGVYTNNKGENSSYIFCMIAANEITFEDNSFWGCGSSSWASVYFGGVYCKSWARNIYNNNTNGLFMHGTTLAWTTRNDVFGDIVPNTATDIIWAPDIIFELLFNSPSGNLTVSTTALRKKIGAGFLRIKNYNTTTDDFRSWYRQGRFINPSQGATIRQISNRTDESLVNRYSVATKSVATFKIGVSITGQIDNAAYYAGTRTAPNLKVTYDQTSSSNVSLVENTNSQSLLAIFTPTTDMNDIFIDLTTNTDAADADAGVVWQGLALNIRKYSYTFSAYPIVINQTSDAYLASVETPQVNPYITESNSVTVAAYGEFSIDHLTQTVTVSGSTTLERLYDYSQYNLTLDANMGYPEWFTTIDGVNYVSTYDIVLDTGVSLTGGGTVDVGTGTFTKTGTATYDGIIIYAASREVHVLLNGLAAGSTVQIYDNDNTIELYNDVVAGTSLDYIHTWTVDVEVRIRIRQAGYIPYEYTGDITNTGLALNVSQEADSVYVANGIDGSTVAEFSLSGSTIMIYINDPDNGTTAQRMYNWYMWAIATTTYIGLQPNDVTAQTAWSYVFADAIKLFNQKADVLFIQGANINNASSTGQVIDTAGGPININGYFPFTSASDVTGGVWDEALTAHAVAGSYGKVVNDNLNATVSSRSSHSAADVWAVGARTLTSFGSLVGDVATAVWGAVSRVITGISGTKQTLDDLNDIAVADVEASAVLAKTSDITALNNISVADIEASTILAKEATLGNIQGYVLQLREGNVRRTLTAAVVADAVRKVDVGKLDHITIDVKGDADPDWAAPISTKTLYCWYATLGDTNPVMVGEDG